MYIGTTGHLFCSEISSNIVVFLYKKNKIYFPFFPSAGSLFSVFIPFNFIIAFSTTNSFQCLDSVRVKQSRLCPTTYIRISVHKVQDTLLQEHLTIPIHIKYNINGLSTPLTLQIYTETHSTLRK